MFLTRRPCRGRFSVGTPTESPRREAAPTAVSVSGISGTVGPPALFQIRTRQSPTNIDVVVYLVVADGVGDGGSGDYGE